MSQHDEDRDKVVNALGGKKGLIDSGVRFERGQYRHLGSLITFNHACDF
ncbi:MAG: hypothetical protein RL568_1048 [Actinomycetota bacterium]